MVEIIDRDLAELQRLEEAENDRLKNFGMEDYAPNPVQLKAHQSKSRTILYCGGNRAGKSTFGAMELCYHLTRNYPHWYPKERRFKKPIKAVISCTSYAKVMDTIEPKITALLPKGSYEIKRNRDYMGRILCKDGSIVTVLTLEMANEQYESADWDFAWLDEPQSQMKYQAIRRGLVDRMGQCVITFTPLTEPWMKEELVDKADNKRIEVFTANIRDNKQDISGRPILSEESIREFEENLPEDVRQTRIEGTFFHLKGAVYKTFGEAHQLEESEFPKHCDNPVICILDPHDRLPHHLIWAFIDRQDDIYIDFESIVHCELPDLATHIKKVEAMRGYRMVKRIIDPNFGRKPSRSGSNVSVMQELQMHGASFYEGNDDVELGHMIVRDYLHYNRQKPITAINRPKVYFCKQRVPITIKSVRNLQYDEWRDRLQDKNPKETQKEKDDHGSDCVRYLCIGKPRYKMFSERRQEESLSSSPY